MFYVTTPIYYVNDEPHIGHAYTTVIADALARWHRLLGEETFFLTGTDEHGLKMQRAAEANGLTPSEQADRFAARYVETWRLLDITNDDFIRTTEPRHHRAVGKLLQACYDRGDIELGTYEGLYSVADEAYVTAEEVPELERQGRPVVSLKEENYFFKLSRYERALLDWYESHPGFVQPEARRNEAVGFIRQGLKDFSISRTSIDWGIPLPWDPRHVAYVWFDALTNYLTAIGYGEADPAFPTRWAGARHLLGKDILRFHCVYWPAMLLSAGLDPPRSLHVHGYLLVGGEKMSKTRLNQIAPAALVQVFGVDGFRYHFLADQRFGPDGEFSYEGMVARYNADLANNLGNLAARVAALVASKCGGVGPAPSPGGPLAEAAAAAYEQAARAWEQVSPSEALEATWRLIREANSHLEAHEPWKMEPGRAVEEVLGDALEALRIVAVLAAPAVPGASGEIWRRLGRLPGGPAGHQGSAPVSPPDGMTTWVDSHCHLQLTGRDPAELLRRAAAAGVAWLVCPGTDAAGSEEALRLAAGHPGVVLAAVGLHPHEASRWPEEGERIAELAAGAAAVGECGLDFYRDLSPRADQVAALRAQFALAAELDKPVVVHCRDAFAELYDEVEAAGAGPRTVLHCWTGGTRWTRRFAGLGVTFSFAGPLTYPTGDTTRRAAAGAPPERTMVETDSPFLTPPPQRHASNEPANVVAVGRALAAVWGVTPAEAARITSANAARVFGAG